MCKQTFFLNVFMGLLFTACAFDACAQNIKVAVSGIKTSKGDIVLSIYKDNEMFGKEQPVKKIKFSKTGLVNQTISLECILEPGVYGITLIDDENNNGTIDKNMLGMPKEGFGFSNFYMEKMKRPSFDDFKFEVKKGDNNLVIKVKYM